MNPPPAQLLQIINDLMNVVVEDEYGNETDQVVSLITREEALGILNELPGD